MNELMLELNRLRTKADKLTRENNALRGTIEIMVEDMCRVCGRKNDECFGACDQCKWRAVREGVLPI